MISVALCVFRPGIELNFLYIDLSHHCFLHPFPYYSEEWKFLLDGNFSFYHWSCKKILLLLLSLVEKDKGNRARCSRFKSIFRLAAINNSLQTITLPILWALDSEQTSNRDAGIACSSQSSVVDGTISIEAEWPEVMAVAFIFSPFDLAICFITLEIQMRPCPFLLMNESVNFQLPHMTRAATK